MSLQYNSYKNTYTSPKDNIIEDFLLPSLKYAVQYDRAVGFFSSSVLMSLSVGIANLLKNNGRMRVVCSHKLSDQDIDSITKGYENKEIYEDVIDEILMRDFSLPTDEFEKERFNILSHLISSGRLEIKIAFPVSNKTHAMYHNKLGVIVDANDNFISFSGSMNDSINAFQFNYECIDVFTSFSNDFMRALEKKQAFEELWENQDEGAIVIDFPKKFKDEITKYQRDDIDFNIDRKQFNSVKKEKKADIPKWIDLRDYQNEAIKSWENSNYIGIYDMATGTGKTITALASIVRLLKSKDYKLGIVICCPYQHLVNQWCEDLDNFNFDYIVGFSGSPQKDWKNKLKQAVFNYSHSVVKNFCFITTNASFATKTVQNIINEVYGDLVLVIDEAHNFGTRQFLRLLDDRFRYRLALSATLDRHNDINGTSRLYDYFKQKCIVYDLKRAINEDKLTKYKYFPVKVYLTSEELEKYNSLSKQIIKFVKVNPDGSKELRPGAEMLLIKRARLVAGAENKINKLRQIMNLFKDKNHLLIYCGATTVIDSTYSEDVVEESEIRQIDMVSKMLSQELGIRVSRFTSSETPYQREIIKKDFDEGELIQALVAIRCLDEGVNIPSIETAIILASSTNPKEYIQRRGRVLRKYPGKNFATIIDFVTLPRDLEEVDICDDMTFDKSLVRRELSRVIDFSELSLNSRDSEELIEEIENAYGNIKEGDYYGI